jgi:hypothetical protein
MRRQKLDPDLKAKLKAARLLRNERPSLGLKTRLHDEVERRPNSLDDPDTTARDALD